MGDLASRLERIEEGIERVDKNQQKLCNFITGGSEPERGLLLRVHDLEQKEKEREEIGWEHRRGVIGAMWTAIGSAVVAVVLAIWGFVARGGG